MAARSCHPRIPSPKYGQTAKSETAKHKSRFAVFGEIANPPSCLVSKVSFLPRLMFKGGTRILYYGTVIGV